MDEPQKQIVAKLAELANRDVSLLEPDRALRELVQDSLALVEIVVELQEEFNVQLQQSDLAEVVTVRDLTTLIDSRMRSGAA
jgi:acyl carrier protein